MQTEEAHRLLSLLSDQLKRIIVGQDEVIEQLVVTTAAGGHALVEGVPGTAKTLMVRALAEVCGVAFTRIQFTPDLMPSDILGVSIYQADRGEFRFNRGPIFSDMILADEINRTPAKTQAALLEAMQEHRVTLDGQTHELSEVFTVFATQNPVEFEGTYPLPEAQVDRFLLKILVDYPAEQHEAGILDQAAAGFDPNHLDAAGLSAVLSLSTLQDLRTVVGRTAVEPKVLRYMTALIRATRECKDVSLGASPRSGVMLLAAARAQAIVAGRDFVTPDDVQRMALPVLRHRLTLLPEVELSGRSADDCLRGLISALSVPR